MPYRDYNEPGVNVFIERQEVNNNNRLTDFLPVFFGTGMTSVSREVETKNIIADVSEYPEIVLSWGVENNFNYQIFKDTDFSVTSLFVHKEITTDEPLTELIQGTDFEVVETATIQASQSTVRTKIRILNTSTFLKTDLVYDLKVKIENTEDDFDLRLIELSDKFYAREIFGPYILEEDGNIIRNDIAFAAEIAFRTGVQKFYYAEVPRKYGSQATNTEMKDMMEKIYFHKDAYRIVPLTDDTEIIMAMKDFVTQIANPIDKREVVTFVNLDPEEINDTKDIDELIEKVGGFSEQLDNERVINVFSGSTVDFTIGRNVYKLPSFFVNVAVVSLDCTVGMAEPLSTRQITIFSGYTGPYFRPKVWNMLARYGVFIVYQPEKNGPLVIRHQLTTKQSNDATYQEYSIVKNFDAVTKRLRDRMAPYAGPLNQTEGYMEKLDATFTTAVEEVKGLGWAKNITTLQPWTPKILDDGKEEKRTLVGKFRLDPMYPANNLDIHLII